MTLPTFMYGTAWKEERTAELTRMALVAGFRAIDTANQRRHYFEAAVGEAVAAAIGGGRSRARTCSCRPSSPSSTARTTACPTTRGRRFATQVRQSFASSLEHLRTGYVDSLRPARPVSGRGLQRAATGEAWRAMEALQRAGQGAPDRRQQRLAGPAAGPLRPAPRCKPAFVQNRCYARDGLGPGGARVLPEHGIAYQGFSLLTANVRELRRPASRGSPARRTAPCRRSCSASRCRSA